MGAAGKLRTARVHDADRLLETMMTGRIGSGGFRRVGTALVLALLAALAGSAPAAPAALPDGRGWEMVSPVDKNGGQIDPAGALAGGGVLQAAADGASITYGSAASFGPGAYGAPPASQYISRRNAGGWSTENITTPLYSGSYGTAPEGTPYRLFSTDLARGLLLNGHHCRGEGEGCAVPNPPLAGTGAPPGYQNYYLRESAGGTFAALLSGADVGELTLEPAEFELLLAGASPDLRHVVLSTCAALTPAATEVELGDGCDPAQPNLYKWSAGAGLSLVNVAPGATLAAQGSAVSVSGSRIYWRDSANLYLREGPETTQVDEAAGGGGTFQVATPDGAVAFFTRAGHLYRYDAVAGSTADLTPSGGVEGVLGASEDGSRLYYLAADGLFLWDDGLATKVAEAADPSNYPPTTGTARVSADGAHLAFVATEPLTGYDNTEATAGACGDPAIGGERCSEVFLYAAAADALTCVSCKGKVRPIGASTIPGAVANGEGPAATHVYKPRALTAGGRRLFIDSRDALVVTDTNKDADVYQWEAQGTGSCAASGGCRALISSGRAEAGASFVDASSDGDDVFFLTDGSLVDADPGSVDLYDARVGGGFPTPEVPIPCEGNACQSLPPEPVDPVLNTLLGGLGNPAVHYAGGGKRCKKGQVKRRGKCVKKKQGKAHRRKPGRGRGGR
jgi:hypothetical protein